MFPFPHGGVRKPVTFFGLSRQVKGLLPVLFHRAQKAFRRQVCTGKTEAVQLCLQQHGILKKDFAPAGHSRPHEPAFLQIAFIAPLCPQAQVPVPLRLSPECFRFCRPKQFFFPVRRIPPVLGNQHTDHMIGKLLPCTVILMRAVFQGMPCVMLQASRHLRRILFSEIGSGKAFPVLRRIHGAVPPYLCNHVKHGNMGLHIGAVDYKIILHPMRKNLCQLAAYKFFRTRQHRHMIGRLQIIKGHMIIDPVPAMLLLSRKCTHSRVVISLPSGYHFPVAVIRPDFNHILRKLQAARPVQLHRFPVQVGAAHGLRIRFLYQPVLLFYQFSHQGPAFLVGVIFRVIRPERAVPLSAEAQIPYGLFPFLRFYPSPPQLPELFRMLGKGRVQLRIDAGEHGRAERLRVMVCHPESHIRRQPPVIVAVGVRSRNHHVSAQTQQSLHGHLKSFIFRDPAFPVKPAFLPGMQKHLIIDKPAPVFHFIRGGQVHSFRDFGLLPFNEFLIKPVPERLHFEKFLTQKKQGIDNTQFIPAFQQHFLFSSRNPVFLLPQGWGYPKKKRFLLFCSFRRFLQSHCQISLKPFPCAHQHGAFFRTPR